VAKSTVYQYKLRQCKKTYLFGRARGQKLNLYLKMVILFSIQHMT